MSHDQPCQSNLRAQSPTPKAQTPNANIKLQAKPRDQLLRAMGRAQYLISVLKTRFALHEITKYEAAAGTATDQAVAETQVNKQKAMEMAVAAEAEVAQAATELAAADDGAESDESEEERNRKPQDPAKTKTQYPKPNLWLILFLL